MSSDFERQIEQEVKRYLKEVEDYATKALNEAIKETVYSYNQKEYERTNQLSDINNIKCKFDSNGSLIVYLDTDNMNYYSFGKGGSDTGVRTIGADAVIHFLEVGHDTSGSYARDSDSGYDYFYNYPAQHFLEKARDKIKTRYPNLNIEIIRDQPKVY